MKMMLGFVCGDAVAVNATSAIAIIISDLGFIKFGFVYAGGYGKIWCLKNKCNHASHNPTDGSRWMVKTRPTSTAADLANPTDGSRWIVQVQPAPLEGWALTIHRLPSVGFAQEEGRFCRLGFNHPPTAVGGISDPLLYLIFKHHISPYSVLSFIQSISSACDIHATGTSTRSRRPRSSPPSHPTRCACLNATPRCRVDRRSSIDGRSRCRRSAFAGTSH